MTIFSTSSSSGFKISGTFRPSAIEQALIAAFASSPTIQALGRPAHRLAEGVRRHEFESHVILYEEIPDGVLILALVHGRSVRGLAL